MNRLSSMPILIDLFWLVLGLTTLYFGPEWLVGPSSLLAVRHGMIDPMTSSVKPLRREPLAAGATAGNPGEAGKGGLEPALAL